MHIQSMNTEKIKKLGLTEGESRAYLSLLKLGSSTVGPITKNSGISSSKIYEVLNRLIEKGLVSFIIKEKTKHFQALEPERLNDYIEKKKIELAQSQSIIEELIPSLTSLMKIENKQEAEIFIGEKDIRTAYDIILSDAKLGSTLKYVYMHDKFSDDKAFEFFYGKTNYNAKIVAPTLRKKKMKWMGIVNDKNANSNFKKIIPHKPFIQRYTDMPLPGSIDITNSGVFIALWGTKVIGVLIRSKEIADIFNKYFDSLWEKSKLR